MLDIQKLGLTPAAFHHDENHHSADTPGCTCEDQEHNLKSTPSYLTLYSKYTRVLTRHNLFFLNQWICSECGTWHRKGKPHWSIANDQFEVLNRVQGLGFRV